MTEGTDTRLAAGEKQEPACGELRARLWLHVLTDRGLARGRSDEEIVAAALDGGATAIQLRGKNLAGVALVRVGRRLRDLTRVAGALLIVNDRVDVALAVDADGAHVGQDDVPARDARRLLGSGRLLGVSARTADEAVRAVRDGADYIGFGPVFPTLTKPDASAPSGLEELRRTCRAVSIPVVAIGGIAPDTARAAIAAGASGVAVISAIVAAADVARATRAMWEGIAAGQADLAVGAAGSRQSPFNVPI